MNTLPPEQTPDKAPLFRSWNTWYALVTAWLIILVVVFFFITNHFA